jgi:hypothetical protein
MESALEEITDAELHNLFITARLIELHKVAIGRVESYDATAGTVDVVPMVNKMIPNGETPPSYVSKKLPKLSDVPVAHIRGNGMVVAVPLKKGDFGILLFADRNIAAWRASDGSQQVDPGDLRVHTMSSGLFIPALAPDKNAIQHADASNLVIGSDSNGSSRIVIKPNGEIDAGAAAAQYVAMANKAKTWLDAFVGAVGGWTPVAQDGGAALKTALTTANIIGPTPLSTDWSSTNLKAED